MKLAEDLKKAVLQAAMQGKLTKQLESDSSVDELLKKIADEKAKLIEEGKIKKEKPLAEINEEEIPFDIPENWRWEKVGKVLGIARGGSPRPITSYLTNSDDGYNWIKIGDSEIGGKYINKTAEKIIKEGLYKTRLVHKGDLLLSNSMSFGRPYILNIDGCIHDGWLVLHDYSELLNKEFLYFVFSSNVLKEQFFGKVSGAVVKNLNSDKVADTLIPLPPIEEQQRIVEKLNQILPLIDEYGKEEDELITLCQKFPEEMKKSVLQSAMQGKLTKQLKTDSSVDELLKKNGISVSEDSDVIDIPESWKYVKLGNLVSLPIKRGKAPKYVTKSSVLVFAQKCNQKYGPVSMEKALYLNEDLLKRYNEEDFVKANDIVINSTGGGTMGRVGFVEPTVVDIPEKIVPDTHVTLVRANTNIILERYLYTFCKSMQPTMESLGVGSTNQTELRPEIISNLNVPLPPIEEQQRIVEKLNTILPIIDSMAVYGTKKKAGRPKQEEALAFISSLLGTQKSTDSKSATPEILELTSKAKVELPAIVKKYADLMDVTYNRITIRHQKTRWGSCTKTGNLSFNCLIMKMPETVRDYVIVHELAHRKELNHSTKFWTIVAEYCPWYKEAKLWLKDNGQQLMEI
ncbi:YgjP-like metallopeptidase domain-containing protein [Treponema sp.]|uniref:YgjP-like metallopeptidase domain-containing protein n=1 Tax=Treponema sp. TaxID=166 RepID=UPI00298DEAEC|nr:YgjP-like metallopeptidase domain-containing protein [Treponema sp.]MCQ2240918.1 DUF45 domain-containing protein [Treponema sp.]